MKSPIVDLRSDTVTRPTPAMLQAMMSAEVGDDVLGDDPTVLRLQERAARLLGKEASLFTPSGSMANQLAIRSVTEPGDELIIDATTHCYNYETGAPAAISGCSFRILNAPRGIFSGDDVRAALRPDACHFPHSRMVILENTNNRGGGSVWSVDQVADVAKAAHELGLHVHMDGARLMNACVATSRDPIDYTRHVDSVSLCFSKGLGAPVGSVIAGPKAFITRCHRFRKMFGGGMRQSGLLAAAALYALDHHVQRLAEDHAHAARLAEAIHELPGIRLVGKPETNIVLFDLDDPAGAEPYVAQLRERGVWMMAIGPRRVRAVTHLDVSAEQIEQAIETMQTFCGATAA